VSTLYKDVILTVIIVIGVVMVVFFMAFMTAANLILVPLSHFRLISEPEAWIDRLYPLLWLSVFITFAWIFYKIIHIII